MKIVSKIHICTQSFHLAHIESVCEDEDVGVELVGGEGEGEDLKVPEKKKKKKEEEKKKKVPDDAHPQEESQVDAHSVHLL